MENNRAAASHFTGIIRTVAFIVLIAIIAFFVIRWVRANQEVGQDNQETETVAQEAAEEEANEAPIEEIENSTDSDGEETEGPVHSGTTEEDEETSSISEALPGTTTEIPQVGAEGVLLSAITVGGLAYAIMMYVSTRLALVEAMSNKAK